MGAVVCLNTCKFYKSEVEAAKALNVHPSTITRLVKNQIKSKDGIQFVRVENILDFSAENPFEKYNERIKQTKKLLAKRKRLVQEIENIDKELWGVV